MPTYWVVLSDLHEHTAHLERLAGELRDAAGVILSGDLTMFGGRDEAARVLDAVRAVHPNVLAVPGNTDHPDVLEYLEEQGVSLHGRAVRVGDVAIYGVGGANPTPFGTPFELPEREIAALLDRALAAAGDAPAHVLVSHPPPFESGVDRLWSGRPVGSRAVRAHIEAHPPALVLCGHIHEGRGTGVVGATPVHNPGPFVTGGFVRITIDGSRIEGRCERLPLGTAARAFHGAKHLAHKIGRLPRRHAR